MDNRYEEQTRSKLRKNCKISPSNLKIWYHLIEAKVSRCSDEMVAIIFCGSRPWRSDYERAKTSCLSIAKPTSEGYWPRRSTINLTTRVYFVQANEEQSKKLRLQSSYCEYKMKTLLIKVGFCDVFVWSLNTNEVREVAAMANFN